MFFRFVRWDVIESYNWTLPPWKPLFNLGLKLHKIHVFLQKLVHPAKKEKVDRLLMEHLPQSAQGITTSVDSSQVFMWQEREPAERVRDAALLVMISAIMQIGAAAFFMIFLGLAFVNPSFEKTWEMSKTTALVVLLLTTASASVGVIVAAAALKMRELKRYRFCRTSSILAMLPLGFGFVLGLPFGIWALLVLRRPDVKAAFAINERRQ